MNTMMTSCYSVEIPKGDLSFFRSMTKRMGWNAKKQPARSHSELNETTLRAIKDVTEGKTFKAASVADLLAQLND